MPEPHQVPGAVRSSQVTLDVRVEDLDCRLDEAAARKMLLVLNKRQPRLQQLVVGLHVNHVVLIQLSKDRRSNDFSATQPAGLGNHVFSTSNGQCAGFFVSFTVTCDGLTYQCVRLSRVQELCSKTKHKKLKLVIHVLELTFLSQAKRDGKHWFRGLWSGLIILFVIRKQRFLAATTLKQNQKRQIHTLQSFKQAIFQDLWPGFINFKSNTFSVKMIRLLRGRFRCYYSPPPLERRCVQTSRWAEWGSWWRRWRGRWAVPLKYFEGTWWWDWRWYWRCPLPLSPRSQSWECR